DQPVDGRRGHQGLQSPRQRPVLSRPPAQPGGDGFILCEGTRPLIGSVVAMFPRLASVALGAALVAVTGLGIVLAVQGFGPLRLAAFGLAGIIAFAALLWLGRSRVDGPGLRAGAAATGLAAIGADLVGGEPGLGFTQMAVAGVAVV